MPPQRRAADDPFPRLVAHVDGGLLDYIKSVAQKEGTMSLPLVTPPAEDWIHSLEIHAPGHPEPLVVLALPAGPPTPAGYPLRLRLATSQVVPAPETRAVSPADPAGLVGQTLGGGKLFIEACVGEGGVGRVYRARHRGLDMHVAVKVLHDSYRQDPGFAQRFQAEALSASRLDHPNLTRVLDFGQEPSGLLYIAMEYLDGRELREVLNNEKRLGLERALGLMLQVSSALMHMHARKVVHRDIKPENLVLVHGLDDEGREGEIVKLCDFGIAHRATPGSRATLAGTPVYMSPELLSGEEPDAAADIYACGVVLYELLTGVVPFDGDFESLLRVRGVEAEPPSRHVRDLDPRIDRLVLGALAKNRWARIGSARELRDKMRAATEGIAIVQDHFWDPNAPASVPVVPTVGAVAIAASTEPSVDDWLERGSGSFSIAPPAPPPSSPTSSAPPASEDRFSAPPPSEADDVRLIAPLLRQLAETTDPARFAGLMPALEAQALELLGKGHAATLWRILNTLDMIAAEKPSGPGSRSAHARQVLAKFADKKVLAPLAEKALDGILDRQGYAARCIMRAGQEGAHALYRARLAQALFESRERFIAILLEMGEPALPVIHAALERLGPRLTVAGAVGLAEDLLKSLPASIPEATGEIVARYARCSYPKLALVATTALPRARVPLSRAVLVGLLDHTDEDVSVAAIKGIRQLGGIDEQVVRTLAPLVLGKVAARVALRSAAIEALGCAAPTAAPLAQALLAQVLAATPDGTPAAEDLVVVICEAILAGGGDATLVAERWRQATPVLRARLKAVLARQQGPTSAGRKT